MLTPEEAAAMTVNERLFAAVHVPDPDIEAIVRTVLDRARHR